MVSDVDSATVTVTLTLSNPAAGSLSVGTSGTVTSTYVAGTGVWAASGAIADVNTLLAGVVFTPAANFNASFTIATSVSDGIAAPVTGSKAMTGIAVNDVPVNGVPGAQTVDEDTDLLFTAGNALSVSDVDGGSLTIQVTVTNGTFTLSGTAGLSGVTGNGTASVGATGSVANLNAALSGSTFRGTLNYFGPAQLTLDTTDGSLSDNDVVAITVNPVNDAPVADDETFNGTDSAIGNTTLVVDDPTDARAERHRPEQDDHRRHPGRRRRRRRTVAVGGPPAPSPVVAARWSCRPTATSRCRPPPAARRRTPSTTPSPTAERPP